MSGAIRASDLMAGAIKGQVHFRVTRSTIATITGNLHGLDRNRV